jgi:hypothetical protein
MSADQPHQSFEWDEAKRLTNLEKHGIDFLDAAVMLLGRTVDTPSERSGELRRKATGFWNVRLITVIYTFRDDKIRIISARRAWTNEQRAYRQLYG